MADTNATPTEPTTPDVNPESSTPQTDSVATPLEPSVTPADAPVSDSRSALDAFADSISSTGEFGEGIEDDDAPAQLPETAATPEPSDVPDPTLVASESTESPESDVPARDPLLTRMEQMGFQDVPDDPAAARERLFAAFERTQQQAQEQADLAREMQTLADIGRATIAQRQQEAPAAQDQPTEEIPGWWNPPDVDLGQFHNHGALNDDGSIAWKPDTPAEYRVGVEQARAYMQQWTRKLTESPQEVLPQAVTSIMADELANNPESPIQRQLQAMVDQRLADRDRQAAQQQELAAIHETDWLYERDPITNQIVADNNGVRQLSDQGLRAAELMRECESEFGTKNRAAQFKYASMQIEREQLQQQVAAMQQQTSSLTVQQQQRDAHMRKTAESGINRSGSIPPSAGNQIPQSVHTDTFDMLRDELSKLGL